MSLELLVQNFVAMLPIEVIADFVTIHLKTDRGYDRFWVPSHQLSLPSAYNI